MSQLSKNKIKSAGYFIKRLRDNGFIAIKVFQFYAKTDPRKWTILVNPGEASIYITCYFNKEQVDEILFEFNDGGQKIAKNYSIKTSSLEVIIEFLLTHGAKNSGYYPGKNKFIKERLNINDEPKKEIQISSSEKIAEY